MLNTFPHSYQYLTNLLAQKDDLYTINNELKEVCGLLDFFEEVPEKELLQKELLERDEERAYGDFQTNSDLANQITEYLKKNNFSFLLEPTCGKGAFILAALQHFSELKKVVGIEIYKPYLEQTKFAILELFLTGQARSKPEIKLIHADIFDFDFYPIQQEAKNHSLLILGNPPWVTNAEIGTLEVKNLPKKSNFRQFSGLDAMTGKGNFDLGEYITLNLLQKFGTHTGTFAFLVKNQVVKNTIFHQPKTKLRINDVQQLTIDTKKEFDAAVSSGLFLANLNAAIPAQTYQEYDFYKLDAPKRTTGWVSGKFVYSAKAYQKFKDFDGTSPFVWRQGIKHDCSKIMELSPEKDYLRNGLKEEVKIESDLVYGLLKSSDLKALEIREARKRVIVTQRKVGQETRFIQDHFPQTYAYLNAHRAQFERRKSSIYKGKPPFSIFGIGDYSFLPYKVAISGMYKQTTFSLVHPDPETGKPVMLDDTCYFIGFETLEEARTVQELLNHESVQALLKAIIFPEQKRPITKEILMRIDLQKVAETYFQRTLYIKNTIPQPTLF